MYFFFFFEISSFSLALTILLTKLTYCQLMPVDSIFNECIFNSVANLFRFPYPVVSQYIRISTFMFVVIYILYSNRICQENLHDNE